MQDSLDQPKVMLDRRLLLLFLIVASFLAIIVFYGPTDDWAWDPSFYYAQIRSLIIENDLDFSNETIPQGITILQTVTGLQGSPWPIGPGILWSPFFLLAHLFVLLVNPTIATGFSSPYIALVSFGSALYGLAGLFVLYKVCRYYGGKYVSFITILLSLAATPLFYYIFHQPIMAHSASFLVATILFLFYIMLTKNQINRNWSGLIFGVLLGLNFLVRLSGILFVVFPMTYYVSQIIKFARAKDSHEIRLLLIQIFVAIASLIMTISPQLVLWQKLYGNFMVMPQSSGIFVNNLLPINTIKIFFDTNRGLLFWSPFILIGMLGIIRIPDLEIRVSTTICLISQIILIGYRRDWFGGGGFGARYFIELLPLIAIGFVCLMSSVSLKPYGQVLLAILVLILIIHQSVLVYVFEQPGNGWVDYEKFLKGEPLGLRWQIESLIKLIKNPRWWFAPRPYVGQDRQTILVNLLAGIRNYRAYIISGIAAVLTPFVIIITFWIRKYKYQMFLPIILIGIVLYMLIWSVCLTLVG